jgi:hypothetical protein
MPWNGTSMYILGRLRGLDLDENNAPDNNTRCSLDAGFTPECSTHFESSASASSLEVICEGPATNSPKYHLIEARLADAKSFLEQATRSL